MDNITVNEALMFELTSSYAKEYGQLPPGSKKAIQYAFEQGVKRFAQWHEAHEDGCGFQYTVSKGEPDSYKTCLNAETISKHYFISLEHTLS